METPAENPVPKKQKESKKKRSLPPPSTSSSAASSTSTSTSKNETNTSSSTSHATENTQDGNKTADNIAMGAVKTYYPKISFDHMQLAKDLAADRGRGREGGDWDWD